MPSQRVILGIDAAWTATEPSGVALIRSDGSSWEAVAVAPSYESFVALGRREPVDWGRRPVGSWPEMGEVTSAACTIAEVASLDVIAVDMPMSRERFSGRRTADREISRAFGGQGCSTHSPNASRPGRLGSDLTSRLAERGFPLATADPDSRGLPCAIEVYPHPALLSLLAVDYRVPYKVSRSSRYWKRTSVSERIEKLLAQFERIYSALTNEFGVLPVALPEPGEATSLASLKRYEDALDALICAWVGARFSAGAAESYGDESAAVWVPTARTRDS